MRISQVIDNKQINNFLMRLALFWFLYAVDGKSLHAAGGKDGCGHPNQGNDDTLDSDPIDGTTGIYTLTSDQTNSTVDASFMPLASLGGRAFSDTDSAGIQDAGEAGISGVTVRLLDSSGSYVLATTTTDANGLYSFANLAPGSYRVQFDTPNLLLRSPANQGNDDTLDSDPIDGVTGSYTLTSGQTNSTVDAGFMPLASIGGRAFSDADSDGIQDAGEAGISGVSVRLLGSVGSASLANPTTTDANGFYSFANLTPGSYRVQFDTPNLLLTSPANQGNDDNVDSDPVGGVTSTYALTSGQTNSSVDAGFMPLASLGGRAFSDADSDGIQDAGEAGLSGVTVWLLPGSGSGWLATTTTNANGFYSFANLTAGSYRVQFDTPNLLLTSPADQGNDDTLDSDPVNGVTGSYTLTSGQTNSTVDAGWIF